MKLGIDSNRDSGLSHQVMPAFRERKRPATSNMLEKLREVRSDYHAPVKVDYSGVH